MISGFHVDYPLFL